MICVILEYCHPPVSTAPLGHTYPAFHRTPQTVFGIRSLFDSKPYYLKVTLGCKNTLGPHERKLKESTGIVQ